MAIEPANASMAEAPMEIDALYGDKGKKGKHVKGKKGKDRGKGKHKGKQEISPKFESYCGHCGKWGHKQKDSRSKNTIADVDEEETVESPNCTASSSMTRVTPPPLGLSSTVVAQSTAATIFTLIEDHAQSGWLCVVERGVEDSRLRESETVELLMDTGAAEQVCGPQNFSRASLTSGSRPALRTATGEPLEHDGQRTVDSRCQGEELRVCFTVVDVKRPILAGDDPVPPPAEEETERELMGREVVPPPVTLEVPTPGELNSDDRRRHGLTHLPYQLWCNICIRARGRENRHES